MSSHRYSSEISSAFSWQMSESLGTCLYPAGVDSDSLCQCHTAVQRALQPVLSTTYVSFTNTIFSRSGTSRKTASILILARLLLRLWGQKQLRYPRGHHVVLKCSCECCDYILFPPFLQCSLVK